MKTAHDPVPHRLSLTRRAGARFQKLRDAVDRQPSPPTLETFFAGIDWSAELSAPLERQLGQDGPGIDRGVAPFPDSSGQGDA